MGGVYTTPLAADSTPYDVEVALNNLVTIAPDEVTVDSIESGIYEITIYSDRG